MARPVWVVKEKQWECYLEILCIEAKKQRRGKGHEHDPYAKDAAVQC